MAGEEVRRRTKTHRSKNGDTESSKSRKRPKDDSATTKSPATSDHPVDVDALRKARLSYLAKDPEERRKDMKYEYVTRAKSASQQEEGNDRRSKAARESERKSERRSTTTKRTETGRKKIPQDDSDNENEYVYSRSQRTPAQDPAHRDTAKSQKSSPQKSEEKRKASERRHTEPARRKVVITFDKE